jgi:hypothetical protein
VTIFAVFVVGMAIITLHYGMKQRDIEPFSDDSKIISIYEYRDIVKQIPIKLFNDAQSDEHLTQALASLNINRRSFLIEMLGASTFLMRNRLGKNEHLSSEVQSITQNATYSALLILWHELDDYINDEPLIRYRYYQRKSKLLKEVTESLLNNFLAPENYTDLAETLKEITFKYVSATYRECKNISGRVVNARFYNPDYYQEIRLNDDRIQIDYKFR